MAAQELCTAPRDDHADPVELVTLVRFAAGDDALIFGSKAAAQRVSALLAGQLRAAGRVVVVGPRARPRWQVRVADATGVRIRLGLLDTRRHTYAATPSLSAVSPTQGPTTGGNTVTVTGANLAQTTSVLFGATPAAFTVISNTQIVATAPAGAAGGTNHTVTTPGGTSPAAVYTRVSPPAI